MVEVVYTVEFEVWLDDLTEKQADAVLSYVSMLKERGFTLSYPASSEVKGARFRLRELRIQSGGRPLRVFYAFDPARSAVLLLGGEKRNAKRFYARMIRKAEALWKEYLGDWK